MRLLVTRDSSMSQERSLRVHSPSLNWETDKAFLCLHLHPDCADNLFRWNLKTRRGPQAQSLSDFRSSEETMVEEDANRWHPPHYQR
jgi:hypothetical protein